MVVVDHITVGSIGPTVKLVVSVVPGLVVDIVTPYTWEIVYIDIAGTKIRSETGLVMS